MRTEKEIYDLILEFAENDKRIRAVGMEGSRVNRNVPKDIFQDYDVSYLVTDMDTFLKDHNWIDRFGERIIMQMPEVMSLYPPSLGNWFSYLMLFTDGNRIDLKLVPVEEKDNYYQSDKLIKILLDKDGLFTNIHEPSDEDYHIKRPTEQYYMDCCNEFWWVSTYVAKGLWRKEILYAIHNLNEYVRTELLRMWEWKVGIDTDFSLSIGKQYKYLEKYVKPEEWERLLRSFRNDSYEDCWISLFTIIELFREVALYVGEKLNYIYPIEEDKRVTAYLQYVNDMQ